MYMCWGSNTLATDAHMKIAHNPLDLVSEARVSELQSVDCALQTFETEEKTSRTNKHYSTQGSRAITQPSTN